MRIGLVYLRPRQVVYVRRSGLYRTSSAQAWAEMFAWLARHKLREHVTCSYGLAVDHPGLVAPQSCRYDACIEIPEGFANVRTDGLSFQTLPGGAFARIRHVGPYGDLRPAIVSIRDEWLPTQPRLGLDRRRPLLIIYLDDPERREGAKLRADICIPVNARHDEAVPRVPHPECTLTRPM